MARESPVRKAVRVSVPRATVPPKRIQVVNRAEAPAVPAPTPSPPLPAAPVATVPGRGPDGIFGAAALGLGVLVLILNFVLPWASGFQTGLTLGDETADRGELADAFEDADFYLRATLLWPLLALVGVIVAGVGIVAADFLPWPAPAARAVRLTAWGAIAFFGFVTALSASRFLSLFTIAAWSGTDQGAAHAAVYTNLAAGLVFLAAAGWRMRWHLGSLFARPGMRWTLLPLLLIALVLLLHPHLPLARLNQPGPDNDQYFGELHVSVSEVFLSRAADDLGFALGMLWVALYVGIAAFAASLAGGRLRNLWNILVNVQAVTAVPLLIGAIFTVLLYVHIPESQDFFGIGFDFSLAFNFLLAVGYLGLGILYAFYVMRILRPFLQEQADAQSLARSS